MKKALKQTSLLLFILSVCIQAFTQTGPGGVSDSSGYQTWLKSNAKT